MVYSLYKSSRNKYYVVHSKTGVRHTKKPISYYQARAQMRALNAIYNNKNLNYHDFNGQGFFDSLKSGIKNVYGRVKGFITGVRDDYMPSVRKLLQEIEGKKIVKMIVVRDPIKEEIHMLANAISMNEINKFKKEVSIDDLFHLFGVCTLDDGQMIRFEKNAEIEAFKISKIQQIDKSNIFECVVPNQISLNELLDNTRRKIGDRLFFDYNSMSNNCQDFLYNCLYHNGYESTNPKMKSFIKQDLTKLAKNMSSTSKSIMNTLTDLGKRANIIIGGAGL